MMTYPMHTVHRHFFIDSSTRHFYFSQKSSSFVETSRWRVVDSTVAKFTVVHNRLSLCIL